MAADLGEHLKAGESRNPAGAVAGEHLADALGGEAALVERHLRGGRAAHQHDLVLDREVRG